MSVFVSRQMSDAALQDAGYALARQLGHGCPVAKKIVGESLFTLKTTTSIDQVKKSKRKSYETKRKEINSDVKRREYKRRRPYRYQRIFFDTSLKYEAQQEARNPANITKLTLQRRHLKHLVHAGRTGRILATTLGCLAYRHSPSAVKHLYERLEDAVYKDRGLLDLLDRIRSRTSGRAKPRTTDENSREVRDNRKKNSTADYRNTKGSALREAVERFRHLSEMRLEPVDIIDPIGFLARLNTLNRPCDAYLLNRISELDPSLIPNFTASPVEVVQLCSIINNILESDCSQLVEAFKDVDRNKGKLRIEPFLHHKYRNRRLLEGAYQDCIARQRQVIQTQQQGREKNLDYDNECPGTTVEGAAELLKALAPWGTEQENGVKQALKEVVAKAASRVAQARFRIPKHRLDKRDDLEAEIDYSLIHPAFYRSHWEQYKQYEVIDRTYDIPPPQVSLPKICSAINREDSHSMRDNEPPDDYQGNVPDILTDQDREEIDRWVSQQLTRRNLVEIENFTITVDGVKHGDLQLNPKDDGESSYNLELENGAEIIQTWANDEEGEILLSTLMLDYKADKTIIESEGHSFDFDVAYDGNYKIQITHRHRSQAPEWSAVPARVPARATILTPAFIGVVAGIVVSGIVGVALWNYSPSRIGHSGEKVAVVKPPQPSPSSESGALPVKSKNDNGPTNVETGDKTKGARSASVGRAAWLDNDAFVGLEIVDGPLRVAKDGGVFGLSNYSAEIRQVILSTVKQRRVTVSIGGNGSEEDVKMGLGERPKDIQLLTPRDGIVIADPTFSWVGQATGGLYVISVYDEERSHEVPIARGVTSDGNVWVPSGNLPLGRRFTWQVEEFDRESRRTRDAQVGHNRLETLPSLVLKNARKQSSLSTDNGVVFTNAGLLSDTAPGPSTYAHPDLTKEDQQNTTAVPTSLSSVGTFETPPYSAVQQLEAAKAARHKSHLVLGLLYLRVGRFNEAAQQFQVVVNLNPHSLLANELLASVKNQISSRHTESAPDKEAK